jgi:hypothetical protein
VRHWLLGIDYLGELGLEDKVFVVCSRDKRRIVWMK